MKIQICDCFWTRWKKSQFFRSSRLQNTFFDDPLLITHVLQWKRPTWLFWEESNILTMDMHQQHACKNGSRFDPLAYIAHLFWRAIKQMSSHSNVSGNLRSDTRKRKEEEKKKRERETIELRRQGCERRLKREETERVGSHREKGWIVYWPARSTDSRSCERD